MTMLPLLWLIVPAVAGQPAPSAFELLDVEVVEGRPVNRYRALELGERPVRPIAWEVSAPEGIRHGLIPVGPHTDSALAVAWNPGASALWVDADGNRRLSRDERHEFKAGETVAIAVTIAGPDPVRRTIHVRPGLIGGGPRYTVRGSMAGELDLGGKAVRTLLIDGDADGCFDAAGTDRVWVDLDRDGRFDPVAEQFPLGTPIHVGRTSYTVASDPWARSVAAHERDSRLGRVRLSLGGRAPAGKVVELSANLVSKTGELVTVRAIDAPTEAPVGKYRIAGLTLQLAEASGRVWSYTFGGGKGATIDVTPGGEARADLLHGLTFDVTAAAHGDTRPGDDVDATPHLRLASGLYLANCTTRLGDGARDQDRSRRYRLERDRRGAARPGGLRLRLRHLLHALGPSALDRLARRLCRRGDLRHGPAGGTPCGPVSRPRPLRGYPGCDPSQPRSVCVG